jgi:hypothetical protein
LGMSSSVVFWYRRISRSIFTEISNWALQMRDQSYS